MGILSALAAGFAQGMSKATEAVAEAAEIGGAPQWLAGTLRGVSEGMGGLSEKANDWNANSEPGLVMGAVGGVKDWMYAPKENSIQAPAMEESMAMGSGMKFGRSAEFHMNGPQVSLANDAFTVSQNDVVAPITMNLVAQQRGQSSEFAVG